MRSASSAQVSPLIRNPPPALREIIYRLGVCATESELGRAIRQPLTIERDVGGVAIGAREQVRSESAGPVVPDLGAVQR